MAFFVKDHLIHSRKEPCRLLLYVVRGEIPCLHGGYNASRCNDLIQHNLIGLTNEKMKMSITDLIRVQILKKQPNSVYADADIESINIGNGLDFDDDLLNVLLESVWNEISTDVRKKVLVVLDTEAPKVKEEVINIDDSPTSDPEGHLV